MEKIKEKLELENKNYYDDNKVKILSYSNTDGINFLLDFKLIYFL
jgi:hypothetical protein